MVVTQGKIPLWQTLVHHNSSPRPTTNCAMGFWNKNWARFGTRCVPNVLQSRRLAPAKSLHVHALQGYSSGC